MVGSTENSPKRAGLGQARLRAGPCARILNAMSRVEPESLFAQRAAGALALGAWGTGAVALLVHRAQAHTPHDSAGALAILTWVIGGWAALVWLGSAWHLGRRWRGTARSHRYAALRWSLATLLLLVVTWLTWPLLGAGGATAS